MDELIREREEAIEKVFGADAYKCVISNPISGTEYRKIEMIRMNGLWYLEKYTEKQVFHEKKDDREAKSFLCEVFGDSFKNMNIWTEEYEHTLRLSKKGKLMTGKQRVQKQQAPKVKVGHNREKNYILPQGTKIEPLIDMGVFTKEGKVVNSMYDKYRQINRFIEIVDDEV